MKDKKSKFSLILDSRFRNTISKPILIGERIIESQRREIDHALAGDEQLRRDQLLLHDQLSEQNRDLREAHMKSLNEMEELKRFQGSTFYEFSKRRLIENQDTFHELAARIQELQNEVCCQNDSRDFKDVVRSGLSHVTSQPALHPRNLSGLCSFVSPGAQRHEEFEVALRGCSRDANDDDSRVHAATRCDCSFLCFIIRQVARLVKQGNSSQRSCRTNAPHIQVFVLHSQLGISFRAHFIDISVNGQTHPARDRLCRLGFEHHAIETLQER